MNVRQSSWVVGAIASALALGCASDQSSAKSPDDQSFSQIRNEELASERREFIQEHEQQLQKLDNQINLFEARLEHEAQYVDASQKAEWSQRLFELRQQHRQARAELERARNASPEEWAEMRGTVGYAVDTLQAGVTKMGNEIGQLFKSDENDVTQVRGVDELGVDLCEIADDRASASLLDEGRELVVRLTTTDRDDLGDLRDDARDLAGKTSSARASALIDNLRVDNIDGGVSLIFEPAQGQREAVREQLAAQVERIQNQKCD